uniref:Uncharacterized protein n=1 Tax=Oreochromis aureus TaxID=47969 RepID=A0A668U9Z9_OREAU
MLYDSADVVLEPQFYLFTPFLSFTYWPNVAADELLSVLSRFRSDATQFWNCIVGNLRNIPSSEWPKRGFTSTRLCAPQLI